MARKFARTKLPGLSGSLLMTVGTLQLKDGEEFPDGTTEFSLTYFFTARFPDANGDLHEQRFMIEVGQIGIGESNAAIVSKVQAERRKLRLDQLAELGPIYPVAGKSGP